MIATIGVDFSTFIVDIVSSNNLRTNERVLHILLPNSEERQCSGWRWKCGVALVRGWVDPRGVGTIYDCDADRKSSPERSSLSPYCWEGVGYQLGCWQDKLFLARSLKSVSMVAVLSVNAKPRAPYETAGPWTHSELLICKTEISSKSRGHVAVVLFWRISLKIHIDMQLPPTVTVTVTWWYRTRRPKHCDNFWYCVCPPEF